MSDNISPNEIKRRLIIFLSIPAEVWTDVLKLLPRSNLVQNIAPVCYRLKEISDKNVKTVHVIDEATQFTKKLKNDDPEANQQLEHLAANDCHLVGQFKLTRVQISEKSQAILRHCPDLFNGCQISLFVMEENKNSTMFLECLSHLEKAEPIVIYVSQRVDQVINFWHHPTFLNCSRIDLNFWSDLSAATLMNVFDWLHHQPNGVDCDGSVDANQQVRCMILWLSDHDHDDHIDWLINRCSQDIQRCREPADRRPFVLSFPSWLWNGYGQFRRIENNLTGELLVLGRVMSANGQPTGEYRLRRSLAEEEAGGEDFYAGLFKRDLGFDAFKFDEKKTPKVFIR